MEWYVSRNGPSVAPAIIDDIEKSTDLFESLVTVLITLVCQDSGGGDGWREASNDVSLRLDCNSDEGRNGISCVVDRKRACEQHVGQLPLTIKLRVWPPGKNAATVTVAPLAVLIAGQR